MNNKLKNLIVIGLISLTLIWMVYFNVRIGFSIFDIAKTIQYDPLITKIIIVGVICVLAIIFTVFVIYIIIYFKRIRVRNNEK